MDALPQIPQSWFQYVAGAFAAFVFWVLRGALSDVKAIKGNYMTREEFTVALAAQRAEFAAALQARETATGARMDLMHKDNSENFREVRIALGTVGSQLFELAKSAAK